MNSVTDVLGEAVMPRLVYGKQGISMWATLLVLGLAPEALMVIHPAIAAAAQAPEENPAPPDAAGAAAAAPAPGAAAPAEETPKRQSYLSFFFNALGWRYTLAFLIISFTFVAFLVMNLL